ncbi:MAG: hypothetical protein RLY86_2857 [Pseudomonadota bacterium]|jgi:alkaline phosphatase D
MSPADTDRRGLLAGLVATPLALSGLTGAVPARAATPAAASASDGHGEGVLTRIAFGSCAKSDKDQPIWDAVLAAKPDLFIYLGDNVYLDTRDPAVMAARYAELAAKPGFQRLRASVPLLAIWDDHDYGENDAGADYPMKEESRRQFLDFFGEPAESPRRRRDGIHTARTFGPPGRRVQVILPDLRWNRTPLTALELGGQEYEAWAEARHKAGLPVPGPYARNPDHAATMLGDAQWQWLEAQLAEPADLRILGSSLQVVADFPGWEAWINYAGDHQRLFQAIREKQAHGLIALSGDTHYGEISRLDLNTPYPLWDITSSGLTETWPVLPPNSRRVGEAWRERNFGLLTIDWRGPATTVTAQIRDESGTVPVEQTIPLSTLRVG